MTEAGNGKIHSYPLERLLIFTEEVFESIKKELSKLKINKPKPKKIYAKQQESSKAEYKPLSQRIVHSFEPSSVWPAFDSKQWRQRRMYDWYNQFTLDDRQGVSLKNIINSLQT